MTKGQPECIAWLAGSCVCPAEIHAHQSEVTKRFSLSHCWALHLKPHITSDFQDGPRAFAPSGKAGSIRANRKEPGPVKPAPFAYHAPKTLEQAVAVLAEVAADDGRVLAGGQSLVPTMAFRLARPAHLVDINGVEALNRITVADGKLVIGACVRHSAFHKPVCEGPLGKLLTDVVHHIAHYPIRNRGTFCGSLAHADPASEWCLVLAALDGEVVAQSVRGARTIAARGFFKGIMTTA